VTYNNIYEYFEGDSQLMEYYDPTSEAKTFDEAVMEIYQKLVDHSRERKCEFVRDNIGYLFYADNLLISFCVKPKERNKENLAYFGNLIKATMGESFNCFLFNKNTRGIAFLERIGMKKVISNDLITQLSI